MNILYIDTLFKSFGAIKQLNFQDGSTQPFTVLHCLNCSDIVGANQERSPRYKVSLSGLMDKPNTFWKTILQSEETKLENVWPKAQEMYLKESV